MAILSLVAKLGLDGTGFQHGMRRAESQAAAFGSQLKNRLAAAFTAGAVIEFGRRMIEHANRIKDLSDQYQVTTDEVQRLDIAAKRTGMTFEDIGNALIRIGAAREKAQKGDKESQAIFSRFGIGWEERNDQAVTNLELLFKIAQAMRGMEISPQMAEDFRELGGRSAPKLLSALKEIENVKLDPIPQEALDRIDQASEELSELATRIKGLGITVIADFLKGIQLKATEDKGQLGLRDYLGVAAQGLTGLAFSFARRGQQKRVEETIKKSDEEANAAMLGFFLPKPGEIQRDIVKEEKEKEKVLRDRAIKSIDSDALARIGGFTGPQAKQDLITPEVRRIVNMLQRGLKIQEL